MLRLLGARSHNRHACTVHGGDLRERASMADAGATPELVFGPPGPGTGGRDAVHFPRPATRYWSETHPAAIRRGTQDFARFYCMVIDAIEMHYVNGSAYNHT